MILEKELTNNKINHDTFVFREDGINALHCAPLSKSRKKEQYFKFLFISEPSTHDYKETIESMDELKLRQFDVVFILGDANQVLLRESSILFESALILQLPSTHFFHRTAKEFFVSNFNKKSQRIENSRIVGFGQNTLGESTEMPVGDIVVSNVAPENSKELQEYIQKYKPVYVFFPGKEFEQVQIGETLYVSLIDTIPLIVPNPEHVLKKRKRAKRAKKEGTKKK